MLASATALTPRWHALRRCRVIPANVLRMATDSKQQQIAKCALLRAVGFMLPQLHRLTKDRDALLKAYHFKRMYYGQPSLKK